MLRKPNKSIHYALRPDELKLKDSSPVYRLTRDGKMKVKTMKLSTKKKQTPHRANFEWNCKTADQTGTWLAIIAVLVGLAFLGAGL